MRRFSRLLLSSISVLLAGLGFAMPASALDWSNTVVVIIANPDHDSDSVPTLSYANSDYDMMLEFVRDGLGVAEQNIKAIKNADRNAFKRVFDAGRWLDQQVQRTNGANVLVYISAHGVPDDAKHAYFVPSNGLPSYPDELYSRDKVVEALERAKALQTNRSSQVLAIFDSCFSGSSYAGDVSPGKTGLPTVPIRAKQPITIMSATQGKGIAYPDEESGLSALTSAFLLGAAGQADETAQGGNGDGTLSIGELAAYVKRTVPYKSQHNQQPQIDLEGTYDLPVYSVTKFRAQMAKAEADSRWHDLEAELEFSAVLDLTEDQLRQQIPRLRKLTERSRQLRAWCTSNTEACKGFHLDLAGTPDLILGQRMRVDDQLAWLQAQDPKNNYELDCKVYQTQCDRLKVRNSAYSCLHAEEMAYECHSEEEVLLAVAKPIAAKLVANGKIIDNGAPYFVEEVRKKLVRDYGISEVNEGGLFVWTSADLQLQAIADDVLRKGLLAYDKRHGYRGVLAQLDMSLAGWRSRVPEALSKVERPKGCDGWHMAAVLDVGATSAIIALEDDSQARIRLEDSRWAREAREDGKVGPKLGAMDEVVQPGDVIMVTLSDELAGDRRLAYLQQKPEVNGGLIAMSPHTGRVLAMSGGWSFADSEWNRAVQAKRQPGSTIMPFVFLAALDQGFSPRSQILDSPVVYEQPDGTIWRPGNYDGRFLGQQPMRVGLEKSRNLMTVRLASAVGMDTVTTYAKRFGIGDGFKPYLSSALGATEATLIDMTTAYAMLANGGRQIVPTFVDRIQDRKGKTLFRHDQRPCSNCSAKAWANQQMPVLLDDRVQMFDPVSIFQIQSMLRGVVERGTARNSVGKVVDRPVAGKTGTTNNYQDAWFVGFTPNLVVGTYIGFDTPRTLGRGEGGGSAAGPMFAEFVNRALENTPPQDFRIPRGVVLTDIDPATGLIAD